ncbi:MAG: UDP-2,3-diacylglucosamine diphosphatase [Burkholderiaceae bacterium]
MELTVPALAVAPDAAPLTDPVFISDLHLAPERPRTLARFLRFMDEDAPRYRELAILGDLFEFWIGDDAAAAAAPVIAALARASARGQRIVAMHGNRDLLLGPAFSRATGATLLADPIVVEVSGVRTLLTHGDAWCMRDVVYQQFRARVREPAVQSDFLSKPIEERLTFFRTGRLQSEGEKSLKAMDIMDVTPAAVVDALAAASVHRVIHGHTHRPAVHEFYVGDQRAERWVLPDWEFDEGEVRGGYLDFVDNRPRLVFFDD